MVDGILNHSIESKIKICITIEELIIIIHRSVMKMEWILFDKDGTLIEFDKSWEKIGIRLVDSLLDEFPVANKEVAHRQLGVLDNAIVPDSVMGSGSLDEMIKALITLLVKMSQLGHVIRARNLLIHVCQRTTGLMVCMI